MKWLSAKLLLLMGVLLLFGGLVHGLVFVNVPYQDPSAEQLASWNLHSAISSMVILAGLGAIAAAAIMIFAKAVRRLHKN